MTCHNDVPEVTMSLPVPAKSARINPWLKSVHALGRRRWFLGPSRFLTKIDVRLQRATHGRRSLVPLFGMPSLLLATTGRRSGLPRSTPLTYVLHGRAYAVVGSNVGRREHPAWSANLLADPRATVTVAGATVAVRARLVDGAEREQLWTQLCELWPGYLTYATVSHRNLRLFLLEPVGEQPPADRPPRRS
ncbi:nitroreductase family deazaflavin-dependent oxidoreductase [Amycolatopsis sp. NPDC059021]|uniref:nitroreductase family deazaflavin-dependent oxidoreductase n=1 Tax=Amycolatopsis sp. NPDC059021 TaxID=3346704 RepID=UPI003671D6CF